MVGDDVSGQTVWVTSLAPDPINSQGLGDTLGPKPYKFIGFGDIHGPKPYKIIGLGDILGPNPLASGAFGDDSKPSLGWLASDSGQTGEVRDRLGQPQVRSLRLGT